jgi:PPOX class probable F420-dependent enzyme
VTPEEARTRFSSARVARLATVSPEGQPHLVPVVFVLAAEVIYTAVDHKPKRSARLRRLVNVEANPAVALLADHYDDADWGRMWWARADGTGRVLPPGTGEEAHAIELLAGKYRQYEGRPPAGPVLAVKVVAWAGWTGQTGSA